jgi:hypothetical protein
MVSPSFPNNPQVRGWLGGFLSGDNGEAIGVRFLFRHPPLWPIPMGSKIVIRHILPLQRG